MKAGSSARAGQSAGSRPPSQTGDDDLPLPVERIWQVIAMIPRGSVATYGDVARLAGLPNRARLVGRTLGLLPPRTRLPWHRVINASRRISARGDPASTREQRRRLVAEGVRFVKDRVAPEHLWGR